MDEKNGRPDTAPSWPRTLTEAFSRQHPRDPVVRILEKALAGQEEISIAEGTQLLEAQGFALQALFATADALRQEACGSLATYVVNRNINFTNVCVRDCGFCAFSRAHMAREGYFLPIEEVVRRAVEAQELGATEVCVQAGLAPGMPPWHYVDVCRAIKKACPQMHIHGFSPEEILYAQELTKASLNEVISALQEAGVGSLPGTSAEILVDSVRDQISPGRIRTKQWLEVLKTAHDLGLPTTSTMMYGHVETPRHVAQHLAVIRTLQKESGGITEFVPLGFIHSEAPMSTRKRPPEGLRSGPSGVETMRVYAVSRLMLHPHIKHVQVSWVKEGMKIAQLGLLCGADDLGGTLINESISTAAGAQHGQVQTPAQLRELARAIGRTPAERTTTYGIRRVFEDPHEDRIEDPLDRAAGFGENFGSYQQLIRQDDFRFRTFFQLQKQQKKEQTIAEAHGNP